MTREQAMQIATDQIDNLLRSGNWEVFEAARGPDGRIDRNKLITAAQRATAKLADEIMALQWE